MSSRVVLGGYEMCFDHEEWDADVATRVARIRVNSEVNRK
jgi:hypothetical protein